MLFRIVVCGLLWQAAAYPQPAMAAEGTGGAIDCTDVSIDYTEDPSLTRDERLRLMDEALLDSLNRFELCQSARKASRAAGGGPAGNNASGAGSDGGGAEGDAGISGAALAGGAADGAAAGSVAGATMSGTEPFPDRPPPEGIAAQEEAALQNVQDMAARGTKIPPGTSSANGKLPEDIPPAANDDALAAQIRYAAENEPDPVKAAQLWNEYRKYKGIALKN